MASHYVKFKPPLAISSPFISSTTTTTSSAASHSTIPSSASPHFITNIPPLPPRFLPFRNPFPCYSWRRGRYTEAEDDDDDDEKDDDNNLTTPASAAFDAAVNQFNRRQYYECHDSLEALWIRAENERSRTLFHGILQCAVGFHHLFNQFDDFSEPQRSDDGAGRRTL
ncbi:hypothetical protein LINGRAHAP2_LOCUS2745 [Linum grandiflorum]